MYPPLDNGGGLREDTSMSSDRTASRIVTETAETIDAADRDEITRDEALDRKSVV